MPAAPIIIGAAVASGAAAAVGTAIIGASVFATAVGTGVIAGAITAVQGGDAGDILKSAVLAGVSAQAASVVSSAVTSAVSSATGASLGSGISTGATSATAAGLGTGISTGAVSGTAAGLGSGIAAGSAAGLGAGVAVTAIGALAGNMAGRTVEAVITGKPIDQALLTGVAQTIPFAFSQSADFRSLPAPVQSILTSSAQAAVTGQDVPTAALSALVQSTDIISKAIKQSPELTTLLKDNPTFGRYVLDATNSAVMAKLLDKNVSEEIKNSIARTTGRVISDALKNQQQGSSLTKAQEKYKQAESLQEETIAAQNKVNQLISANQDDVNNFQYYQNRYKQVRGYYDDHDKRSKENSENAQRMRDDPFWDMYFRQFGNTPESFDNDAAAWAARRDILIPDVNEAANGLNTAHDKLTSQGFFDQYNTLKADFDKKNNQLTALTGELKNLATSLGNENVKVFNAVESALNWDAKQEGWADFNEKRYAVDVFGPAYNTKVTPEMYRTLVQDIKDTTYNANDNDKIATVNEARDAAILAGYNTFIFGNGLYTIGGKSLDAADTLFNMSDKEFVFDGTKFSNQNEAILEAYKSGFNTVKLANNQTYNIPPDVQQNLQKAIDFPGVFDGSKYKDVNEAAKAAAAVNENKFIYNGAVYVVKAPESVTNQIKNARNFNEAFALAQEKLGEGNVFEWNGKLYVNKTKEQAATDPFNGNKYEDRGAAAYAAHMAGKTTFTWGGNTWELPKDYASQISKALGDNPYQSAAETKRLVDANIKAASSNVLPAEKFRLDQTGIPAIDKIIGAIAYSQGLAVAGTGNILESLSEAQALATNGSFQNTLKNVGNILQTFGERMKPEEFATMAKPQVKNIYDDLARAEKTENILERGAIVAKSLLTNPIGTWTIAGTEMGEEAPGLLLGGLAIVFSPLTVGLGSGASLLAAISATLNGAEVFGSSGAERYRELIAQGKTEEEARVGGIVMGAVQAPITIITEFAGDKATALAYLTGIKSGMQGAVQTIVNPITVNALTELVEEYVQGVSARVVKGEPQNFAEDSARAIFAAAIGASTSAGFVAPGAINNAAQIGLDRYGQSVTFQEYINNTKNVDPSTLNMNAKVAKLSDGSDLTLAGLQLMLPATGISRSFIYDIAPDITVSRNDIVAYSSNNEPIQFRYSQPFFQKHLIQVGPIPNISDADARRLLQTQGRSNPTQAEIDQVVDKAKDEQDTDIAKQIADPFTVSLEEVKEAARAAGYAISDEEAKKYVGERLESEAIPLLQQQFDPLATTEEEVRQIFAERGYTPTQQEIERFVGSTPEAQIQSQVKTYVDPRMLYPEDIKNLAAQEGYEISDARARELSGQKDKYASLNSLRAEFDAGAVTLDEARAMFAQTPYKPTDAEIQQFIGSKSESQIQQDIANYVDPRYVTAQEIKDAAAQEGYQITDEQALALAGQKNQQEALAQFRAKIDPQAVNEAEVRAFFREQGYQPTNEELQQFIASRSEAQVMADIAAYVDPRYITLAEVKQVANEEGYAITDDEAFALTGQKSQKDVLDQLRAKADASAVLQSEAEEFFKQYGYTPTAEELEQFTGSRAEDLVRSEIGAYVDPRYVTLEEVKEAARAEGYDITDEEAAALVGQKSQEEAIAQFREQIDPKAVIDAEAQAFFAEFGYVPNNDELSLFIQSRSEDEVRADIQTYIDPRQVTREEVEAKFRELQSEYGFTPEEIEQFIRSGQDITQESVLGEIGGYIDPRYVTPEEVKAGYAELGLTAPIEEDISKFTGQTAQEGLQERLQEYLPTAQFNYTAKQLADLQAQNDRNQRIQQMNDQFVRDITALIDQDIDINTAIEQTLGKIDDPTQRQLIDVGSPTVQMLAQQQATKKAARQQQKQQLVQQGMEFIGGQTPEDTQVMSEPFKPDVQSLYSGDPGDEFISPLKPFLEKVEEGSYTGEQPPPTTAEQPLAEPKDLTDMKRREQGYFTYGQPSEIEQNIAAGSDPFGYYSAMAMSGGMKEGGMVAPLMAEGGGTRYGRYAGGGLNLVPHTGKMRVDFREGDAVTGPGDGQSDDIPAMLADGEFVIPADVVAALGNGSTKAGSDKLYDMMHSIRSHVRSADPKKLPPPVKSPLDYISKRPKAKRR